MSARLAMRPIGLKEANLFVGIEHRDLGPVRGYKFALCAYLGEQLVGVVIVGRTTAKGLHSPVRAEVTRLATDGTRNCCSFLYQRAKRVVQAMGYTSLKTYTKTEESGASLRAIGACCEAELEARSWEKSSKSRPRSDKSTPARRFRWELLPQVAA
jgi:hypothetical protein